MNKLIWHLMSDGQRKKRLEARGLSIGFGCEILNGWDFGSEPYLVEIGDNVRIASGVKITTHDGGVWVLRHLYPDLSDIDRFGRVRIGNNCHIGVNACILPGVSIGNNCIVGAGAIVTKDVPAGSVVAGVPARLVCTIEEYRVKHRQEFLPTKPLSWEEKRRYMERGLQ